MSGGKQKDLTRAGALRLAQKQWGKRARAFRYEGGEERWPGQSHVIAVAGPPVIHWTPTLRKKGWGGTWREACERAGLLTTEVR